VGRSYSDIKLVDGGLVLCFLSVYTEKPMSAKLPDFSPIPFPDEKPTDRGKFSPDREYWEQLHQARYTKWQLGCSAEDIAAEDCVTSNAVRHSIAWCEARLPNVRVVDARNTRLRLRTLARLSEKYVDELEKLMSDVNPIIRAKALEAFRKTTGLEAAAGVHVSVNQQTAVLETDRPRSFEEAIDLVRRRRAQAELEQYALPESIEAPTAAD
jgi:hypothetical protein